MKPIVVSDILAVGETPSLDQLEILARAGFKAIINNQPDGEVERFPSSAEFAREAQRCGLAHAFAPITSRMPSAAELAAFQKALRALPSPIFAFCYSGSRSAAACALTAAAEQDVDQIVREFSAAGFDVSALRPWLVDAHACMGPKKAVGNDLPGSIVRPVLQGIVVHARPRGATGFAI